MKKWKRKKNNVRERGNERNLTRARLILRHLRNVLFSSSPLPYYLFKVLFASRFFFFVVNVSCFFSFHFVHQFNILFLCYIAFIWIDANNGACSNRWELLNIRQKNRRNLLKTKLIIRRSSFVKFAIFFRFLGFRTASIDDVRFRYFNHSKIFFSGISFTLRDYSNLDRPINRQIVTFTKKTNKLWNLLRSEQSIQWSMRAILDACNEIQFSALSAKWISAVSFPHIFHFCRIGIFLMSTHVRRTRTHATVEKRIKLLQKKNDKEKHYQQFWHSMSLVRKRNSEKFSWKERNRKKRSIHALNVYVTFLMVNFKTDYNLSRVQKANCSLSFVFLFVHKYTRKNVEKNIVKTK